MSASELPPSPTSPLSPSATLTLHKLENKQSVKPFRSKDEFLLAMKEDLAEWFNDLYATNLTADNLLDNLQDGTFLCQHANNVKSYIYMSSTDNSQIVTDIVYRSSAKAGTFQARDNLANFIQWVRYNLNVNDVLLFESDDLVLLKNEKNVVLCLLEVARRGARYGMPAPMLIQLEQEIDRLEKVSRTRSERRNSCGGDTNETVTSDTESDKASLDEWVQSAIQQCTCPKQFPMTNLSKGKYRVGYTQNVVFVRILRNHVMIRVGGGWDTLEHYLDKHDPCRCRQSHRQKIRQRSLSSQQTPLTSTPEKSKLSTNSRSQSVTELTPPILHSSPRKQSGNGSNDILCNDLVITRTDDGTHIVDEPTSPLSKSSPSKSSSTNSIKSNSSNTTNRNNNVVNKNHLGVSNRRSCSPSQPLSKRSISPSVELMRRLKESHNLPRARSASRTRANDRVNSSKSRDRSVDTQRSRRSGHVDMTRRNASAPSTPVRRISTPARVRRESKPDCTPSRIPAPKDVRKPSQNGRPDMISSTSTCGSMDSLKTI